MNEKQTEMFEKEEMNRKLDWDKATDHLVVCMIAYKEIGIPGLFILNLLKSYNRRYLLQGERTPELYDAIIETKL